MRTLFPIWLTLLAVTHSGAETRLDLRNQGKKNLEPGVGVAILGSTITSDDAVIPHYQSGAGQPVSNCSPGRDIYVDTTSGILYYCRAVNVWQALPQDAHSHSASDISSGALALSRGGTNQSAWTGGRCVQVSGDGLKLESAGSSCGSGGGTGNARMFFRIAHRDTEASANRMEWGSTANVTVANSGTAPTTQALMLFPDGEDNTAARTFALPVNWTNTNLTARLFWTATTNSTTSVRWTFDVACVGVGDDFTSPPFNTALSVSSANTGNNRLNIATFNGVSTANCSAGEMMWIRIGRDGDGTTGLDDLTVSGAAVGVEIEFSTSGV